MGALDRWATYAETKRIMDESSSNIFESFLFSL